MNKNFKKSLAAVACAAVMAAQMGTATFAAVDTSVGYYYYYNGYYYTTASSAGVAAGNPASPTKVSAFDVPANSVEMYYDSVNKKYYSSVQEAAAAGVDHPEKIYKAVVSAPPANSAVKYYYYSSYTGKYYTTYAEALAASANKPDYVYQVTNTTGYHGSYYSYVTGKYYSTYAAALAASNNDSKLVAYVGGETFSGTYYYSNVTNAYYRTYSEALLASGGNSDNVKECSDKLLNFYYSKVTGLYYGSYATALNQSGNDKTAVVYVGKASNPTVYNAFYNYLYGYGYYGYNYPYYGVDGYRWYLNEFFNSDKVSASDGTPYVSGRKSYAGWNNVIKYIKSVPSGKSINVMMNGATVIDEDVLDAFDGKNVTVNFILNDGTEWSINGKEINKLDDMNIYTEYKLEYIPSSLVKKAQKGAVAVTEIGLSTTFNTFAAESDVTVTFAKKRGGCKAYVYRYNKERNSLQCVDKTTVQADGECTFTVTAGGPYLIVLK